MRICTFNLDYRVKALELANTGLNFTEIAERMGISRQTLNVWRKKDTKFNEQLLKARKESIRNLVDLKATELASGVETVETTIHDTYKREDGTEVKRTIKKTKHKPDTKALTMLSNKHKLGYSDKEVEEESTGNTLNLNFSGMTLREVQDSMRNSPIEAECSEVLDNSSDSEDLE